MGGGVRSAARELLASLVSEPSGQISPSVYETARLVRLAPWLVGHPERIRFLLAAQRPDGGWGGPGGYGLVPTLSATDAMLHLIAHPPPTASGIRQARLVDAARSGLDLLTSQLYRSAPPPLPDTPAVELIVPAMIAAINARQANGAGRALPGWTGGGPLALPAGLDGTTLARVHDALNAAAVLPAKLLHSLEVAGHAAAGARLPSRATEMVGASPAATAAWLGTVPAPDHPSVRILGEVARRYGGPVPSVLPISVFERAWVLSGLVSAGVDVPVPGALVRALTHAVARSATPGGAGLPPDADTTSTVLFALGLLGVPAPPGRLWPFETDSHFCTWQGERTPSTTTNAHVLDALCAFRRPGRVNLAAEKVSRWLCERQRPDGSWVDKWHASPYYATACCALALDREDGTGYRSGPAGAAVRRAVAFIVDTQRDDGSWGRWAGTLEETSYALRVLLTVRPHDRAGRAAAARGYAYLRERRNHADFPPLWHDKDLYTPMAVVRATILIALHLGQKRRDIVT